ncbi:MAG: hypothetical protein Q8O22_01545 [Candidatus Omnitrophota bacterium]|nr:hypothetical protein [Candidatus Omnitrophota bacterium]
MNKKIILLFLAASFILSLAFVIFFQFDLIGDEPQYYTLGYNLAKHATFSLSTDGALSKTTLREPLYPSYVAIVFLLTNYSVLAVKICQILFILLAALIGSKLAVRLFGEHFRGPVLIGILFFPTLLNFPQYLYSECLAVFLFMLFVYCEYSLLRNKNIRSAALTGIVYAALILCKVLMLYFIPVLIVMLLLYYREKKIILSHLLMLGVCLAVLFPWVLRNYGVTGRYCVSYGREINNIANRSLKQDLSSKEIAQEFVFDFSETLGKKIFPEAMNGVKAHSYTLRLVDKYDLEVSGLKASGMSDKQIGDKITGDFIGKVARHPFKYAVLTLPELIKMANFSYLPLLKDIPVIAFFQRYPWGGSILGALRLLFKLPGYVILYFVLYFFISNLGRMKDYALFLFLIGFVNIVPSLTYTEARYALVLIPLYVIFAWAGFRQLVLRRKRLTSNE